MGGESQPRSRKILALCNEGTPRKDQLCQHGSIWKKDRVRCAVASSDSDAACSTRRRCRAVSADAAYNNLALIGRKWQLKSVLVA